MHKRYIQSFDTIFLDKDNEATGLAAAMTNLPKRASRRMSRLGIMLHYLLTDLPLDIQTTLAYGTSFSECRTLESYLDSFPDASPTGFQNSIHPGGIEQALIVNKQAVGAFFPMAGHRNLMMQMLKLAFSAKTPEVILCGGEEKGSWLTDYGLAHNCSFAFAMRLSHDPDGACGELTWEENAQHPEEAVPDMEEVVRLFSARNAVRLESDSLGLIRITPK
tara:strand:- start:234 stop:893 length:660 start_codon:yes stop_codon:yes gene_type:complete